jgi:hypothetical protein
MVRVAGWKLDQLDCGKRLNHEGGRGGFKGRRQNPTCLLAWHAAVEKLLLLMADNGAMGFS